MARTPKHVTQSGPILPLTLDTLYAVTCTPTTAVSDVKIRSGGSVSGPLVLVVRDKGTNHVSWDAGLACPGGLYVEFVNADGLIDVTLALDNN